jgi:hypothetical protein
MLHCSINRSIGIKSSTDQIQYSHRPEGGNAGMGKSMNTGFAGPIAAGTSRDRLRAKHDAIENGIQTELAEELITSVTRTEISEALRQAKAEFSRGCAKFSHSHGGE